MSRKKFNIDRDLDEYKPDAPTINAQDAANRMYMRQFDDVPVALPSNDALIPHDDGNLVFKSFTLTPIGLLAEDTVTVDEWSQLGEIVFKLEGSIQWLIGDWLAYGENWKWGSIPEIAERLGRKAGTLYIYASVCRAFDFLRRRKDLSFGHHQAVLDAPLADRDAWLERAEQGDPVADEDGNDTGERKLWSVARLRQEIRTHYTPAPRVNPLATKTSRLTFGRVFRAVAKDGAGLNVKDIEALRTWLDKVEQRFV